LPIYKSRLTNKAENNMLANKRRGANAYRSVGVSSTVPYSDSMQLIQLLFNGLVETLATAEGHFSRNDIEGKGASIERALKILGGLQSSLNFEDGKELARNLSDIYDYASRQLLKANISNNIDIIREVKSLIVEIDSAWQTLPTAINQRSVSMAS
jgi:flagellar protein FliS